MLRNPDTTSTIETNRATLSFWALGALVVVYVALCTPHRDQLAGIDAWEHHRAIVALTGDLWNPGNPTYATDDPSIRYSPYFIIQAIISRFAGIDPYLVLSGAAVFNTILLLLGLWLLLRRFGEAGSAAAALIVMVGLWGGAPGYANTYALADLPWHQVNPSAFSFALTLLIWSIFPGMLRADRPVRVRHEPDTIENAEFLQSPGNGNDPPPSNRLRQAALWTLLVILATVALLDHAMTGAFALFGLFILAATRPAGTRRFFLLAAVLVSAAVAALALLWPWYPFAEALLSRRDVDYWFNRTILIRMLTQWCMPALLGGLIALTMHRRDLVRTLLIGAAGAYAIGLIAFFIQSPSLARFPLPGLIFLHLPIAVFIHRSGTFSLRAWPGRLRALVSPDPERAALPVLQILLIAGLAYFLIPQVLAIPHEPHLARPYVAPLLGRDDRRTELRALYRDLLQPVGRRDVVLADRATAWPIPSFAGRIVAARHYEFFVDDQPARHLDVETFFSTDDPAERLAILDRYDVRWIVLNRHRLSAPHLDRLLFEPAVVNTRDHLILMDANLWRASGDSADN